MYMVVDIQNIFRHTGICRSHHIGYPELEITDFSNKNYSVNTGNKLSISTKFIFFSLDSKTRFDRHSLATLLLVLAIRLATSGHRRGAVWNILFIFDYYTYWLSSFIFTSNLQAAISFLNWLSKAKYLVLSLFFSFKECCEAARCCSYFSFSILSLSKRLKFKNYFKSIT